MIRSKLFAASLLLGAGLGGFFDGIVFHQIAQWHGMLSASVPPHDMASMRHNMRADGWFHAAMWLVTLTGMFLLWNALQEREPAPPTRRFVGGLLLGWGWFNLAEGIVDHHLLELHHVRDLPTHLPAYDWMFLLLGGIGLIGLGWWLRHSRPAPHAAERRSRRERRAAA
jgi:uncharacterized membrane protein